VPNRILKESITTSCEVDNLSADEERLFYRLIVACDDFGRMDARPQIIRAKCFPLKLDSIKDKDIEKWLRSLVENDLIILYEVGGKPFLQMTTWEKHQQKRAKHSKYPAPDNGVITHDINCNQVQSNVPENREYENTRNDIRDVNFTCEEMEILNYWNEQGIVVHEPTANMKKEISKALKKHGKEKIFEAITNYAVAYTDTSFYYSHRWRLDKFLSQTNGIADWVEGGQRWIEYMDSKKKLQQESKRYNPIVE